jgi:mono/diheme cytochrome c family protein
MSVAPNAISKAGLALAALLLVLGGALGARVALADADAPAAQTAPAAGAALIARGKYLTDAADCMPCHSGPNHAQFSGGLVLNTPFGGLASPNITPDKATGIGNWTDRQFWNAIHYGVSPGRSYLVFPNYIYPAMPFTSYTKLTYPDVMAIKAYLFSLAPVKVAETPNTLAFPFSQRPVLLGWRILFFRAGPLKPEAGWDAHVQNGAYLTEALGHCGECHTPRNIMSGLIQGQSLAGAPIDSYFAPNISSDQQYGVGGWSQADLVDYLYQDGNMSKGSSYGPMQQVVQDSLMRLPKSDIEDIALYLQTATPARHVPPGPAAPDAAQSVALGATVYAANCAGCHGQNGAGRGPIIPNLAGNNSVTASAPFNVIGAVLNGVSPWNNGPAMPSFAAGLSDQEIAAVTNYVRTSWGNSATANATPQSVMSLRAVAVVPPMADLAADKFGCPHVSPAGGTAALTDPGSGLLNIYQGATPETLPNRTRALIAALKSGDSTITNAVLTNDLVAAYCPVVANTPGLSDAAREQMLGEFVAGAQPLIAAPVAAAPVATPAPAKS